MNMRKIIAVLSAVLMLCAIVPFSVSAAPGDVIIDADFNDGMDGFANFSVVDGALVLDGTSADWANSYAYANAIKPNTTYQVNFRAKADVNKALSFKINNGWTGTNVQASANITTEWQEFELLLTPDSNLTSPIFTIQTGTYASGGTVYYIDYVKVIEWQDPAEIGKVVNGGFEDGLANWTCDSSASLYNTDAAEGSNSLKLENTSYYASAATQIVPVKANTVYELSWKSKRLSGTGAFNVILCQAVSPWTNYTKVSGQNWMNETSGNWVNNSYTINTGDNTSMLIKWTSERSGDAGAVLLDDIKLIEVKDPSFDGYIYNGDFETGKINPWDNLWGSSTVEMVEGYNSDFAMKVQSGQWNHVRQTGIAVKPNTDYVIMFYAKDAANINLLVKDNGDSTNIYNQSFTAGSEWTKVVATFNSGSYSTVLVSFMGASAGATYTVDDLFMFEKVEQSNDGYIVNGTFETGELTPWNNLWGSCPKAEVIRGGKDDNFALEIVSGEWKHVRQLPIAVEANTDYKITLWAKNVKNMSLLVKDAADTGNIANKGISGGSEWTENVVEFNSGANTSILVSFMGGAAEAYGTFDSVVMECLTPPCEHEYFYPCDKVCMICYEETNPDATHNITAVEAVEATCDTNGNIAYWYCSDCGSAWADEALTQVTNQMNVIIPAGHTYVDNCDMDCDVCGEWRDAPHNLTTHVEEVIPANCQEEGCSEYWICADCGGTFADNGWGGYYETNPAWLYYTGEHVRPENAIVCAIVPCELCGEDTYGESCTRPESDPVCQDSTCIYCGEIVWGWGCNYNTGDEEVPLPLCQAGTCVYCGTEYEYLYECENGAWAPCQDGECSYGCGKQYPATENHTLEDCTVDGNCSVCWSYIPAGEHEYDNDFDVDCNVCGAVREVEFEAIFDSSNSISEDVSGLATRFDVNIEGLAIKAGKFTQADYTNATLNGYKLISMGVIASNGASSVDVPCVYLCDLEATTAAFATRVINIPADKYDVEISFQSYFVVEIDGEQVTIFGDTVVATYNQFAG